MLGCSWKELLASSVTPAAQWAAFGWSSGCSEPSLREAKGRMNPAWLDYRLESSSIYQMSVFPATHSLERSGHCAIFPGQGRRRGRLQGSTLCPWARREVDTHRLCCWHLVHWTLPSEEEELLQSLQGGTERRDDIWFSRGQLVDFDCLKRGLVWLSCLFFLPWDRGS